jgi:DNA repair protein RadC
MRRLMPRPPLREAPGLFAPAATADARAAPPSHLGHRERLKARLMQKGPDSLQDYELLELVLFRAVPQGDVKPLAKLLIETFGDVAAVVAAEPDRLRAVKGVGEAVVRELKVVEAAAHLVVKQATLTRRPLGSWTEALDYLTARMACLPVEEFRLLFLDKKNRLIADEAHGRGTVDQVGVFPREVAKRALALNASGLIIAHNHPSGDPAPSQADVTMTRRLREALATVDVTLHDHFVIGRNGHASLHALGML